MRFRLAPKLVTLNFQIFAEFCSSSHFWEATTAKRMKIDPYTISDKNVAQWLYSFWKYFFVFFFFLIYICYRLRWIKMYI